MPGPPKQMSHAKTRQQPHNRCLSVDSDNLDTAPRFILVRFVGISSPSGRTPDLLQRFKIEIELLQCLKESGASITFT